MRRKLCYLSYIIHKKKTCHKNMFLVHLFIKRACCGDVVTSFMISIKIIFMETMLLCTFSCGGNCVPLLWFVCEKMVCIINSMIPLIVFYKNACGGDCVTRFMIFFHKMISFIEMCLCTCFCLSARGRNWVTSCMIFL